MQWRGILITSAAILVAVMLLLLMRPASQWLVSLFMDEPKVEKTAVGTVEEVTGIVEIREGDSVNWRNATVGESLFHSERLRVANRGFILLKMKSKHSLEFEGPAELIVERWSTSQKESPFLISMVRGDFTLREQGHPGQLFILQDKKVFPIEAKPAQKKSRVVEIVKEPEFPTLEIYPSQNAADESLPPPKVINKIGAKLPDKIEEDQTLSNGYIESVLTELSEEFRRCQMNTLRDRREAKGQLLLSLTIEPTGKVLNVRVMQSSQLDNQLVDCSVSVITRARFKRFEGLPISLSYPIDYR